jgi:hypothetical protein
VTARPDIIYLLSFGRLARRLLLPAVHFITGDRKGNAMKQKKAVLQQKLLVREFSDGDPS